MVRVPTPSYSTGLEFCPGLNRDQQEEHHRDVVPKQHDELLIALKARFDANQARHPGLSWAKVQARLAAKPEKLWSLAEMERTGGEPGAFNQTLRHPAWRDWRGQFTPDFVAGARGFTPRRKSATVTAGKCKTN